MSYHVQILAENRLVYSGEMNGTLELGRQRNPQEAQFTLQRTEQGQRLAIAPLDENQIGRRQLMIRPQPAGKVEVANISSTVALEVVGGMRWEPSAVQMVSLPVTVLFPAGRTITISGETSAESLQSLDEATIAPGHSSDVLSGVSKAPSNWQPNTEAEHLVQALGATMDVFQSAQTARDLIASATRGAVQLAGFDRSQVLMYEEGSWKPAECNPESPASWPVSQTVLGQVAKQKRTFWETEGSSATRAESLAEVEAVIAAPILNPTGEVIGALYSDRRRQSGTSQRSITRLDARLIELLACGVASGYARMEQEATTLKLRLQFEQFFTPELARELENHPDLLDGRDADVSILFCDIRGFSRISERIGAKGTFEWINDVMGVLSDCVTRYQGVLVDYIGDELMAMWGAPQPQENHALLACRAALDMLNELPNLNNRWEPMLGETMDLGIGINSGPVRAGNAGSKRKFKYSPLGNAVNLASRVQGATKYLKTRLLITGATADQLDNNFLQRRLASVRVVNIGEAVPLWELSPQSDGDQSALCERYAKALTAFEEKEFREAARGLAEILGEWPNDGPSLILLKRTVNALADGPNSEHPVWTLDGK